MMKYIIFIIASLLPLEGYGQDKRNCYENRFSIECCYSLKQSEKERTITGSYIKGLLLASIYYSKATAKYEGLSRKEDEKRLYCYNKSPNFLADKIYDLYEQKKINGNEDIGIATLNYLNFSLCNSK